MTEATAEGALQNQRIEFIRETTRGETPANPSWNLYSDAMQGFTWSPAPTNTPRGALGSVDPVEFHSGTEEHDVEVVYDLQQWVVDGSGNPKDASGDGVIRDNNNRLDAWHSVVDREELYGLPASECWGSTSRDSRTYIVGTGGAIDQVDYEGDPSSQTVVLTTLAYKFEKVREYQIDQPASGQQLEIVSTDNGDTSQTVTVEDDGANIAEDLSLNGTTAATTTSTTISSLDAFVTDTEASGDIHLQIASGGDILAKIRGQDFYDHGEGDLGVPALGSGSHASAIGSAYEKVIGDSVEWPSGTSISVLEINSVAFSVQNNISSKEQVETPKPALKAGDRVVEVSAAIAGPTETRVKSEAALAATENNLIWTLTGGTLQADSAVLTSPGEVAKQQGEADLTLDNTFQGQGVTVA